MVYILQENKVKFKKSKEFNLLLLFYFEELKHLQLLVSLLDYLQYEDKTISLKQDYFDFKKESTLLMNAVKNHFEKLLKEMRADFPTVEENEEMKVDDSSDEESEIKVNTEVEWNCFICLNNNQKENEKCRICAAPRDYTQALE